MMSQGCQQSHHISKFEIEMNNENDTSRISLHDFNELEGQSLRGFLNIKGEGAISQNQDLARDGHLSGNATYQDLVAGPTFAP